MITSPNSNVRSASRRKTRSPLSLVASLVAIGWVCGCANDSDGSSTGGDGGEAGSLPVDVLPVTQGDWWRPEVSDTWQWQLSVADGDSPNTSYEVAIYDLDLFDTSVATIDALHADGRRVLCYFSAGSHEDWREDAGAFDDAVIGKKLGGWAGERWLDIRAASVLARMEARLDLAVDKGCDGVEPDNVDGYANDSGFSLSYEHQLAFNRHLANAAHDRGLAVALKNDVEQVADLVEYFDLSVDEECHAYDECDALAPFIERGRPVLNAEYTNADDQAAAEARGSKICDAARSADLRTLILPLDLDDAFRVSCD